MQASIGFFFLILSGCTIYLLIIYKGQADRQNEILDVSSEALSKWREVSYGISARVLESSDMLSPTEANKIVGEVITQLSNMDARLGTIATAVNDAYLESLRTDKSELINLANGNSCQYAFDGECDEPSLCPIGTDTTDCL
jgi:predicted transcriptional regulator